MKKIILSISLIANLQVFACDVTVTDSDSLKDIATNAQPGQEICIDGIGGKIYKLDYIHFSANGTKNAPIIFKGLGSVHLLGVDSEDGSKANFHVSGQWLTIKNFEVSNFEAGVNIRRIDNNVPHDTNIINIKSHDNLYSGISIEGDYIIGNNNEVNPDFGKYTNTQKPYNNTIKNCDASYSKSHGNGDGINIRNGVGPGNIIIGCRTFFNADDGVDLWEAGNQVKITNTWSFGNGMNGDGVGFKLGRAIQFNGTIYDGMHILKNCMSWDNKEFGFSDSEAVYSRELYNCTAYHNKQEGFHFENDDNAFIKNISYANENNDMYGTNPYALNNSWQIDQILDDDYFILSQDEKNIAEGSRENTGNLPDTKWLQLKEGVNYPNIGYQGNTKTIDEFGWFPAIYHILFN